MWAQPKNGVFGAGQTRKKNGVLGAGQVEKLGSLPRHIPILDIYVSAPGGYYNWAAGHGSVEIRHVSEFNQNTLKTWVTPLFF